jgi:hypothetical protein
MTTATYTSLEALMSALADAAPGDELLLAAGAYAAFGGQNLQFAAPGVTIGPADPENPPTLAGAELADCHGMTFLGFDWHVNPRTLNACQVYGGDRVYFRGGKFQNPEGLVGGAGVLFRDSTDVECSGFDFSDIGTAVRINDARKVRIIGNKFRRVSGDGIQSSGSSEILIHRNDLADFITAEGDHPDAIQFFTHGEPDPQTDITITDNLIVRGVGGVVQGIFLGNENGVPFQRVVITGNSLSGCMWNGIALGICESAYAAGNFVQPYVDCGSAIVVDGGADVTVENNVSGITLLNPTTDLVVENNVTPPTVEIGDTSDLELWLVVKNIDDRRLLLLKELKRRYDEMAEHLSECELKVGALTGLLEHARRIVRLLAGEAHADADLVADALTLINEAAENLTASLARPVPRPRQALA